MMFRFGASKTPTPQDCYTSGANSELNFPASNITVFQFGVYSAAAGPDFGAIAHTPFLNFSFVHSQKQEQVEWTGKRCYLSSAKTSNNNQEHKLSINPYHRVEVHALPMIALLWHVIHNDDMASLKFPPSNTWRAHLMGTGADEHQWCYTSRLF